MARAFRGRTTPVAPAVHGTLLILTPDNSARRTVRTAFRGPAPWFCLIGLGFIASAFGKAARWPAIVTTLEAYKLVPGPYLRVAAVALVVAELAVGVGLLIPRARRAGAAAALVLLLLFAIVVGISLLNRLDIECGCGLPFGTDPRISWALVGRNLAIVLVLAGLLLLHEREQGRLSFTWRTARAHASAAAMAGVVVLMAAAILNLQQRNAMLSAQLAAGQSLQVGDRVRPFRATLLGGGAQEVGYDGPGTVMVFVFSANCPHCETMVPRWNESYGSGQGTLRFVGVSLSSREDTERFTARLGVRFPVSLPNDLAGFVKEYRPPVLPFTIEIGPGGEVLSTIRGVPRD
jgi:uncharacterized membrane protein YphA (DoxX/SURF4 family)